MAASDSMNYQDRYKLLFENSFEAMVIFAPGGKILEVNQHMADMLGYRVDELVGKNVFEFMLPEERGHAQDREQKASEGQSLPMVERTIMRKDGSKFIGEANLSPIKDEDGNLLYLLGILRDLTERKQLEATLREKEAQLRQIGDNLPDGFIYRLVHTPDGKRYVRHMTAGVERVYGTPLEDVLADVNILYAMMVPEDLVAVVQVEEESIENQTLFDWEGRFRLPNGEIRWTRYHSKPTVLPDGTRIWDGVALDITNQKQAEEALRMSETRIRALLDASIDIALLTQPDGTIIALNEAAAQALQGIQEELIGKNVLDLFPPEISAARGARSEEVVRSGKPVHFEDERGGKWFRNHIYPILDAEGQVVQLAVFAHDITERISLQQVSRELTNITDLPSTLDCVCGILETLFASPFVGIGVISKDETIQMITQSERSMRLPNMVQLIETPAIQELIEQRNSLMVSEVQTASRLPEIRTWAKELNLHSVLLAPLVLRGEAFGFLLISTDQAERVFSEQEIALAEIVANDIASAVENARLLSLVQEQAVADERIRIARELHDSVTQTMYSVSMVAEALPRLLDRNLEEAKQRAIHLRQMTLGALAEMRNLLFEFHPKALRDTRLSILLRQLGEVLTGRTRIPVDLDVQENAQLPEDVKIAFYRVAQEAFNNIYKHAQASQVSVSLQSDTNECRLNIQDDGVGFYPQLIDDEKLGLKIMSERADAIGAELVVESSLNQGTKVLLVWVPGIES